VAEPESEQSTPKEPDRSISHGLVAPASIASKQPTHKELWEMAIKLIEIENNLINNRLTALIALALFLGGFLSFIVGNTKFERMLPWIFCVTALFGIAVAVTISAGVRAARRQIMAADVWLKKASDNLLGTADPDYLAKHPYPPPKGGKAKLVLFGSDTLSWGEDHDYEKDYGITLDQTNPKTLQIGFANFPDVFIILWIIVLAYGIFSFVAGSPSPPTNPPASPTSASGITTAVIDTKPRKTDTHRGSGGLPEPVPRDRTPGSVGVDEEIDGCLM